MSSGHWLVSFFMAEARARLSAPDQLRSAPEEPVWQV
jgi:hypothetical protein